MAIMQECPICRKKQSTKNNLCIGKLKDGIPCEANLKNLKKHKKKVRYYISYRIPGMKGKQRMEFVGYSVTEARDADGKRKVQKRENKIFDMLPESEMTFNELTDWYLKLPSVKKLADYSGMKIRINNFNKLFGDIVMNTIKPIDLESYQAERKSQGIKNTTIDIELNNMKGMIFKAFENDMAVGITYKVFRKVKKISLKSERTRKRALSIDEYLKLLDEAAPHLKGILITAFHTGMRPREIRGLKWKHIDRENMFIRLPANCTKEKAPKDIPINYHVQAVLNSVPRAISHDFVFTYKGNPIKLKGGASEAFQAACRRAGIPYGLKTENGLVMKDFRKTFKSNMLRAGVDKTYRDKIVGHSLKGMDVHYIIINDDDLKNAMDIFTNYVDKEIESVNQTVNQKLKKA